MLEIGETYTNSKHDDYIMVLAIEEVNDSEIWVAVGWVDKTTMGINRTSELSIAKSDLKNWKKLEF